MDNGPEAQVRQARSASIAARQVVIDHADRMLALPCLRDGRDFSFTRSTGERILSARYLYLYRRELAARELAELRLEELLAGDAPPARN